MVFGTVNHLKNVTKILKVFRKAKGDLQDCDGMHWEYCQFEDGIVDLILDIILPLDPRKLVRKYTF